MVETEQRKQHFPFAQEILPQLRNLWVLHYRFPDGTNAGATRCGGIGGESGMKITGMGRRRIQIQRAQKTPMGNGARQNSSRGQPVARSQSDSGY
jgi:hypothetical protein